MVLIIVRIEGESILKDFTEDERRTATDIAFDELDVVDDDRSIRISGGRSW
jgi:hypothetical protein